MTRWSNSNVTDTPDVLFQYLNLRLETVLIPTGKSLMAQNIKLFAHRTILSINILIDTLIVGSGTVFMRLNVGIV